MCLEISNNLLDIFDIFSNCCYDDSFWTFVMMTASELSSKENVTSVLYGSNTYSRPMPAKYFILN